MKKNTICEFNFYTQDIETKVVAELRKFLVPGVTVLFFGPLGVGKTTIIKSLLKSVGVTDIVNSPTFSYINAYRGLHKRYFNHFDLYRILTLQSFFELGFQEYLFDARVTNLIEWPEVILDYLQENKAKVSCICVNLSYQAISPNKRHIHVFSFD